MERLSDDRRASMDHSEADGVIALSTECAFAVAERFARMTAGADLTLDEFGRDKKAARR